MPLTLSGTNGVSGVDGTASNPSIKGGTSTTAGVVYPAADTVAISTASTERLRVDSAGNLGLGVTPSAWVSGGNLKAIQLGNYSFVSCEYSGYFNAGNNCYEASAGSYKYLQSSYQAALYQQASGQHQWYNAPSGTAGNAITFTQAMTLDASGNLQIGTTTAGGALTVKAPALTTYGTFDTTTTDYAYMTFKNGNVTCGYFGPNAIANGNFMAITSLSTYPLVFGTAGTERARIDSSGNFFIEVMATTASAANVFVDTATTPVNQIKRSTSSRKYKTDIHDYDKGIEAIKALRSVYYKGINDGDTQFAGLIAEEVDEAGLHEFVQYASDKTPDALAYGNMAAIFVKSIQELSAKLDAAEARIAALEAK